MSDTPYNPETGEWTVFQDPRPDKPGPYGKGVFYKPGQREGSTNTRILLWGDTKRAEGYYPQAAQMLQQANFETAATGELFKREKNLGNGVRYKCSRDLYQDFIEIEAKPQPVPSGKLHLNFDASSEEFYKDGCHKDKNWGFLQYYRADSTHGVQPEIGSFGPSGKTALGIKCASNYELKNTNSYMIYNPKTYNKSKTILLTFNSKINANESYGSIFNEFRLNWGFGDIHIKINHDAWFSYNDNKILHNYNLVAGPTYVRFDSMDSGIVVASFSYSGKRYKDEYGAIRCPGLIKTYLNGSLVGEEEFTTQCGEYNEHYVYSLLGAYSEESTCYVGTCQQMVFDALLSKDEITETTDTLAKKWSF